MDDYVVRPSITDEHRRQYYIQVLESYRAFIEKHPAGFEGALITMDYGGRIGPHYGKSSRYLRFGRHAVPFPHHLEGRERLRE